MKINKKIDELVKRKFSTLPAYLKEAAYSAVKAVDMKNMEKVLKTAQQFRYATIMILDRTALQKHGKAIRENLIQYVKTQEEGFLKAAQLAFRTDDDKAEFRSEIIEQFEEYLTQLTKECEKASPKLGPRDKAVKLAAGCNLLAAIKQDRYGKALEIIRNNQGFFGIFSNGRIKEHVNKIEKELVTVKLGITY